MGKKVLFCLVGLFLLVSLTVINVHANTWIYCGVARLGTSNTDIIVRLTSTSWTGERWFHMDLTEPNAKENYATLLTAFANDYEIHAQFLDDNLTENSDIGRIYIMK